MLKDLPEGSRYAAAVMAAQDVNSDEAPQVEKDPLVVARRDRRTWNLDRQLLAQLINSINLLIRVTGHWPEGKGPDFPTVGPTSWSDEGEAPTSESILDDVLALFTR